VRDALGLVADTEVDLVIDGASIRLDPVAPTRRVVIDEHGFAVLEKVEGFVTTDEEIRQLRDDLNSWPRRG
jgi:hypothetical protein